MVRVSGPKFLVWSPEFQDKSDADTIYAIDRKCAIRLWCHDHDEDVFMQAGHGAVSVRIEALDSEDIVRKADYFVTRVMRPEYRIRRA